MAIKILIADRLEVVRYGLRTLIEGEADWEVCGEAASGDSLLELAKAGKPDIVVLDASLPGLGGVAMVGRLREALDGPEILMFSAHDDPEALTAALSAGARGFVLKDEGVGEVLAAIRALARRQAHLSPAASQVVLARAIVLEVSPSAIRCSTSISRNDRPFSGAGGSFWIARASTTWDAAGER